MRGQGVNNPYVVLVLSILLCSILLPVTAHAVQYGHVKQVEEPALPEMKCGEPGHEPLLSINELSHSRCNVFSGEGMPRTDTYAILRCTFGVSYPRFIVRLIDRFRFRE